MEKTVSKNNTTKDTPAIVILGWADIRKGAMEGGGYNLFAMEHARYLVKSGFQVHYLQSGFNYTLSGVINARKKPLIRFFTDWKGVRYFRLFNSHNRAPGIFNHQNREFQIDDSYQNTLVCSWLNKHHIERVYIHSLEGQSLSLIRDMKKATKALVTVICHDHFYVCPQVKLLFQEKEPCIDYEEGLKCRTCVPTSIVKGYKVRIGLRYIPFLLKIAKAIWHVLQKRKDGRIRDSISISADNPNRLFIEHINQDDGHTFYAQRRRASIEYLSYADRIYSPSDFIARYLEACGIPGTKIRAFRLGLPHLDRLKSVESGKNTKRPLTFCYLGLDLHHKGIRVFLESLLMLDKKVVTQCKFVVYGVKDKKKYRCYQDSIPGLSLYGPYSVDELATIGKTYDIGVLPHIWFENSPITLLEHLALGKPVLAAAMGGVVEYIEDGKNGWLCKAGSPEDLSVAITKIALGEWPIPRGDRHLVNNYRTCIKELSGI